MSVLANLSTAARKPDPRFCPNTGRQIIELSHSGLNTFASCPKRFAFRKIILNHHNEWSDTDATSVGTAMHEGLQEYMRTRDTEAAVEALALHHPIDLLDNSKASVYSLEASTWTLLRAISSSELPHYDLATFVKDGVEHPATEIAFLVVIEFEGYIFHLRGFIDLVLRNSMTGRFLPVDIKTTTAQGMAAMEEKFFYDWQVTSYGIPLNALLGNEGAFDVGIFGVIMSDRDPIFKFPIYERKPADVEDYQFYLLDKCRQIISYLRADHFPRHPQGCLSFGRICHYHKSCYARTVEDMQLVINPSRDPGADARPFDPIFTAHLTGE